MVYWNDLSKEQSKFEQESVSFPRKSSHLPQLFVLTEISAFRYKISIADTSIVKISDEEKVGDMFNYQSNRIKVICEFTTIQ